MVDPKTSGAVVTEMLSDFAKEFQPLETGEQLLLLMDNMTNASYCECHLRASKIISLGTTDAPLDYEEQTEYRANRDIVLNSSAYKTMIEDAKKRRSFSNIVAEYTKESDSEHPLKIIGGQHRFEAIREAFATGIDEYHGVKVYFSLDITQRLDVQLISNTNIAISRDLIDRLQEGFQGPDLRKWAQTVGLLEQGQDFSDSYERGGPISVKMARTFITNYFKGKSVIAKDFDVTDTTPVVCPTGSSDPEWDKLKNDNPNIWTDSGLLGAAKEFATLVSAQRNAFKDKQSPKYKPDYPEKALNIAVLSAWAFTAGILHNNVPRLNRHFELRLATSKDPLNADALAKGRHKTDPQNYRGLGYRMDPQERGRLVELFYIQAEDGRGITPSAVDIAIKQFHVKQAQLEVMKAKAKAQGLQ